MSKSRAYSKYTLNAVELLGCLIKQARKDRHWSESELAERAGISRLTLRKIEKGDASSTLGLVFEVASLVGIQLFELDEQSIQRQLLQTKEQLTLLPQRIRQNNNDIDDEF